MSAITEAREKREKAYVAVKELREKFTAQGDKWADEGQRNAWSAANADYDAAHAEEERLTAELDKVAKRAAEIQQREEERGRSPGRPDGPGRRHDDGEVTDEMRRMAFHAWARRQCEREITDEQREACRRVGLNPSTKELPIDLGGTDDFNALRRHLYTGNPARASLKGFERRALSKGTTTAGGHTVPASFMNDLEVAMLAFGGVRQVATVMRTDNGQSLPYPTMNDTGNSGALLAENAQAASDTDMTFGVKTLGAYKFTSKIVLVSYELLEDSAFDLSTYLAAALGERLGRAQNAYATTGTGSSQPAGIVTGSTIGKTAAATNAITADELVGLQHSVDPAYRQNAGWMMHDAIVLALRLLKDSEGVYLWRAGLADNRPDTLLGQPLTINQSMASSMAADAKTVLYGDFSKMLIREVRDIRLRRMVERYGDYDQDGFVAFLRFDSIVLNAGTNPIKHLVQAAS